MKQTKILRITSAILSLVTLTAEASLTAGTVGGESVVYDNITNITWTSDANLLGTLESKFGFSTLVNDIIAASPTINNTPNRYDTPIYSGHYTITSADFGLNGSVTWFGAKAFTRYLNNIKYAGSNQWTLPTAGKNPQWGYNQTSNPFGNLYYNELNALAPPGSNGFDYGLFQQGGFFTPGDLDPFTNVQNVYWLDTEIWSVPQGTGAWGFNNAGGAMTGLDKNHQLHAWAVSPGNVTIVPVPPAVWLFGSGLMGLVGWRRRSKIRFVG